MTIKIGFNQKILFLIISGFLFGFIEFEDKNNKYSMRASEYSFTLNVQPKNNPDRKTVLYYYGYDDGFSIFDGEEDRSDYFRYFGFNSSYSQTYNLFSHEGVWWFSSLPATMFWGYNYGSIYENITTNKRIDSEIREVFDKSYRELVRRFLKAKELEKSRGIIKEGN